MLVAWGQFMDHDITLTAETRASRSRTLNETFFLLSNIQDPQTGKTPECCEGGPDHPNCMPIKIAETDKFFSLHKKTCMNFVRVEAGVRLVSTFFYF